MGMNEEKKKSERKDEPLQDRTSPVCGDGVVWGWGGLGDVGWRVGDIYNVSTSVFNARQESEGAAQSPARAS